MKLLSTAALALFVAAPAFAGTITIDFETAPSFAPVGSTYAASGVNFGGSLQGLANDAAGPYFSNAPSPLGVMFVAAGGSDADASMNVDGGFYGLSFFYSSLGADDAVQVYSGINGTGDLLVSLSLAANATTGGCTDIAYCHWNLLSASWAGAARSVTFRDGAAFTAFDNVSVVPEPSSVLLAGLALGAAFVTRRRAA